VEYNRNDFEVIVVDDGSDEQIDNELKKFRFNIKYLYFPRSDRSGSSFSRNKGIENASGNVLIFLDCDQLLTKNFIIEHVMLHKRNSYRQILQIGTRKMLLPDQNIQELLTHPDQQDFGYETDVRAPIFINLGPDVNQLEGLWFCVFSHNISVTKKSIEKYGGFDENFKGWGLEDVEFGYRMHKNGVKIIYNPGIEILHQYHLSAFNEKMFASYKKNYEYMCSKYHDTEVKVMEIFFDLYDPVKRKKIIGKNYGFLRFKSDEMFMHCFLRFELTLYFLHNMKINPEYIKKILGLMNLMDESYLKIQREKSEQTQYLN
jgi:glycosyltransferase involved in cell wall biosynthesis